MLIQHINSITHEGKVVVVGTEEVVGKEKVGKIWYKVKQDGFEDSYLNQKPEERTGWEDWKPLELPNEADDQSVLDQEKVELTDQNNNYLLRSRYKTQDQSAVAPVQLVSGLGHIYIFRQSKSNTLLVDRFVLDGLTNALNRKLEVRFKRSKQKHTPSKNQKKGVSGLINIDSLDFVDINGKNFYEPTTELSLINNLSHGWFSVVLVPTNEQDKYRWHIFAYNSQTQKVEITTLRASDEGLFDLKDYTVLDPEPRNIPGIIKRALTITGLTVANGLTATKYDLQKERQTDDGMQLLRESTRVMLVVGTNQGNVAAISFAVAADGTLSEIEDSSDSTTIRRSNTRQILLPLNTLDEIKAIGTTNPPPEGKITGFARGEDDEVVLTSDEAAKLDETKSHQIKVTGNRDYNRSYSPVTKIDENTFEITPESANEITPERPNGGNWEVVREEETGLIFNGIVTAYEITEAGKLKVTALNHGLDDGDAVQVIDTKDYNGTYTVTKVDQKSFSLDGIKWQAGTAISAKLQTQKRQGVIFDGLDDYIQLPLSGTALSSDFTVEAWIKPSQLGRENPVLGTGAATDNRNQLLHLVVRDQSPYLGFCENDTPGKTSLSANTWYHVAFRYSKDKQEQAIFVNGVLDNSTQGHAAFAGTGQLKIGSAATKDHFLGCIADVRIWDKARTADEIKNSMYLQLTGKEVGLVGYWRLDAIVEGKERKVIDFSVNGNDGIVQGGAYISSVRLERNLPGTTTPAIKYENEELFAVSERTTYTEEFEFRTDNDVVPDKADGIKGKLFALTYKGKKNRNSQDWITIPIDPEETKFTPLDKDKPNTWWKASSRFTVPDGVSMVRSFGIDDIKGSWTTLEIRKHQIQLVSDSITEKNYTHDVSNLTLKEGNQLQLQESLKLMSLKEKQEGFLLKEKKELEANIAAYNAKTDTIAKIKDLEGQINKLTDTESKLSSEYTKEKENPFNYYCHLSCKGFDLKRGSDSRVQVYERNGVYRLELQAPSDGDWQKLKFVRAEDNDSYYIYCKGFDLKRGSDSRVQVYYRNDVFGLELLGPSNSDWQKLKFVRAEDNDSYHIYCKADSRRVQVYVHTDVYGLELLGPSNSEWQKLKLTPTNEQANNNISIAWKAYDDSTRNLDGLRKDLDALKIALGAEEGQNQKWKDRLKIVIK